MNTAQHPPTGFTVFLLGALFNILATAEITSLLDYAVRAVVGGMIWLAFKLVGDYLSDRYILKKKDDEKGS